MEPRSPASSPRLPSPPPIAEDQVGPTSPGVSLYEEHGKLSGGSNIDHGASRRIRPGSKAEDMAEGPPLVELQDIDSAFQLTEHLKALHYSHTHPPESSTTNPITAEIARQLARPPPNTSKEIWLYELGRFLIQKTNAIIVALFADSPACSAHTCPEMRASEWQYLCAVHDPPKSCSAIDYCCHTLDWAATTLTSSKMFPSRLGLGSGNVGAGSDKVLLQQMKEITNIFRRVYRIYAHAWFQHRDMFWRVEGKTGLYVLFKTVCDEYALIQAENYTIPPEAEGLESAESRTEMHDGGVVPSLLKRDNQSAPGTEHTRDEAMGNMVVASGDTTKRHRHTMSDRVSSVTTVIQEEAEEEEEEEDDTSLAQSAILPDELTSLKRQPTILHAQVDQDTMSADDVDELNAESLEPAIGITRSDTVKAPRATEDGDMVDEGTQVKTAESTSMVPTEERVREPAERYDPEDETIEPAQPQAAEASEASKSVGD